MKQLIILLIFFLLSRQQKLWNDLDKGEYKVGFKQMIFKDHERSEYLSQYAQDQMCDYKGYRQIHTSIYYPVDQLEDINRAKYVPDILLSNYVPEQFLDLFLNIPKFSYKLTPLSQSKAKFPVVFFNPGFGVPEQFYTCIVETLASYGYIVFSIQHPYANGVTYNQEDDCLVSEIQPDFNDPQKFGFLVTESANEIVKDLKFLWNEVISMNENSDGFLSKKMDLDHFVVMGHSLGGMATTLYCQENYCKAAINLDGGSISDSYTQASVDGSWPMKNSELQFLKFGAPRFPGYEDEIPNSKYGRRQFYIRNEKIEHQSFSDLAYVPISQEYRGLIDPDVVLNNVIININNFLDFSFNRRENFDWVHSKEMESTLTFNSNIDII